MCVTNRKLCREDFLVRLEQMMRCDVAGIILREKDLSAEEYEALAIDAFQLSNRYDTTLILHSHPEIAFRIGCNALHMPLQELRKLEEQERMWFRILGASCHSVEEAIEAEKLGCTYITAGHIYVTDCKKGIPPRGLEFLYEICKSVTIPVWGIGGIGVYNIGEVISVGGAGGCIMSSAMQCEDFSGFIEQLDLAISK